MSVLFVIGVLTACSSPEGDPSACDTTLATGWSLESHTSEGEPDYARIFSLDEVLRVDITLCPEDAELALLDLEILVDEASLEDAAEPTLELLHGTPVYVPALVTVDGRSWPQVGFRYKGNSSLVSTFEQGQLKLPFRLKFDHFEDEHPEVANQRLWGFKELKFGNNYNDPSMVRDLAATESFRAAGVPVTAVTPAAIYVDVGEGPVYWGLYVASETPCSTLLTSRFGSDDGNCYKADGYAADLTELDDISFSNQSNASTDQSDLAALVDALAADRTDADAWRAGLEARIDVDAFLRYQAINNLLGNWDVYGNFAHNYYLYADPAAGGQFAWIPADFNASYVINGRTFSLPMTEVDESWPLISYTLADSRYQAVYRSDLDDLLGGVFSPAEQQERLIALHDLVRPYVVGEGGEVAPYTLLESAEAFDEGLYGPGQVLDFIEQMHALAESSL